MLFVLFPTLSRYLQQTLSVVQEKKLLPISIIPIKSRILGRQKVKWDWSYPLTGVFFTYGLFTVSNHWLFKNLISICMFVTPRTPVFQLKSRKSERNLLVLENFTNCNLACWCTEAWHFVVRCCLTNEKNFIKVIGNIHHKY